MLRRERKQRDREIIPAIIANDFTELKEKVERVSPYVKWVQIDVMDGKFVPNTSWNRPEDLASLKSEALFEAHLMILEPERYVEKWIDAGIKRIIFHIEATSDPRAIIKICRDQKVEVGIAINPETPADQAGSFAESIDMILVLGVTPGFGGQEFKPSVLEKIKALRRSHPYLTIGVDGGMTPATAKLVIAAGANVIAAGSYIFECKDTKVAIEELKNAWQS